MLRNLMATEPRVSLLVLRLLLGGVMFPRGAQKVLGWWGGFGLGPTIGFFTSQMHIPLVFAWLAVAAEFLGSLGLIVGLLTRVAAFGIAVNMAVAVLLVHLKFGFFMNWMGNQKGEGFEYHLLAVAAALALIIDGAGAASLDHALSADRERVSARVASLSLSGKETSMRKEERRLAVFALVGATALAASGTADAAKPVERLTAFAVDMSNLSGARNTATVDISIDRWSTEEEANQLRAALREGGPEGLLRALQKVKQVGHIISQGHLGYPLRFAREIPLEGGGRRVLIGTDRLISFLELRDQPRTVDYPFMLIDIRLSADGKGEGKLMPLAKITEDRDHIVEIENYASEPVRLTVVRSSKKK